MEKKPDGKTFQDGMSLDRMKFYCQKITNESYGYQRRPDKYLKLNLHYYIIWHILH